MSARRTSRADVTGPGRESMPGHRFTRDVPEFRWMHGQTDRSCPRLEQELAVSRGEVATLRARQSATARVLQAIATDPAEPGRALEIIAECACALCGSYDAVLLLRQGDQLAFGAHYGPIPQDFKAFPLTRGWTAGRCVLDRRAVHIADLTLEEAEFPQGAEMARRLGHRTILSVPMLAGGDAIGSITLRRFEVSPFSDDEISLLATFADQAVIAIENTRLISELGARNRDLNESLQQQTATAEVLKVISRAAFDLPKVLDALLDTVARLCGADLGTIRRRDGERYRLAATYACPAEWRAEFESYSTKPDRGSIFGRTIVDGHTVHVPDVLEDAEFTRHAAQRKMGIRAVLGVPLTRDGNIIGVLILFRFEPRPFTEREIEFVETFADQAVIAIENTRLFDELRDALQQQTATAEVLKVISRSTFDLRTVLSTLVEAAVRLCEADRGTITREQDGQFVRMASHGFSEEFVRSVLDRPVEIDRSSVLGRSLLEGRIVHIPDVVCDPEYTFTEAIRSGVRALVGIPLLRDGRAVGGLVLARTSPRPFTEKQFKLLETFADQAAIAIENARLFEAVQARTRELDEALTFQKASANVLEIIGRSRSSVQPVLDAIVETAADLCRADMARLRIIEDGLLRRSASSRTDDDLRIYADAHATIPVDRSSVAGRVVLQGETVHIPDVTADPEYKFLQPFLGSRVRTVLGVPLLRDGAVAGVIILMRREMEPFSPGQIELVKTFANHAVIALDNARLFHAVQARTRELQEALEYQTAASEVLGVISRSPGDSTRALAAIAESAAKICEAHDAVITLRRGDDLVREAHHGPIPANLNSIPLTRGSANGRAVMERRPIHVTDMTEADAEFPEGAALARELGHRTILCVPLLREDEAVGSLMLRRQEVSPFSNAQISLIETFADQAVIAIENARLFTQLKNRQAELLKAKEAAETALAELTSAQERLVQTEKLASLGQLTAGIAHEIKNPLNFVNNFASLSGDLLAELEAVLQAPIAALDEAARDDAEDLLRTVRENLDKIVHHGRRADSIVRNMLLHARQGAGEWRATDINSLADEALTLAYHSARAEHPDFNVDIARHLDPDVGRIECCPQDVMRVILNLVSNGIYAANRKRASVADGFIPRIELTTRAINDGVEIEVRDNGTGIPTEIRDSIFVPFFTTKPAGEGTGLGLSLSHDIIVKQHGGALHVESHPGTFTLFRVRLPRHAMADRKVDA